MDEEADSMVLVKCRNYFSIYPRFCISFMLLKRLGLKKNRIFAYHFFLLKSIF